MSRLYPTRDLPDGDGGGGGGGRRRGRRRGGQTNGRRKRPPRAHYLDLACQRDITRDDTAALFFIHSPECRWRNISESLRRCNTCSSGLSPSLSSVFPFCLLIHLCVPYLLLLYFSVTFVLISYSIFSLPFHVLFSSFLSSHSPVSLFIIGM